MAAILMQEMAVVLSYETIRIAYDASKLLPQRPLKVVQTICKEVIL
jgi:hypothetical protein